jgi:acyl dehydratase
MDKIRFMAPTRVGDTIHCEVEVIEITDKGNDKGILTTRYLIKNQKRKVIMSFII